MKKILLSLLSLIVIVTMLFFYLLKKIEHMKPEDFVDTQRGMTREISDSLIVKLTKGLNIYKEKKGNFPITDSKYYLDSIIEFVDINPIYIYRDTMIENKFISQNHVNPISPMKYIGVGNYEYLIKYSCSNGTTFKLTYVPPPPL
jgi:hypothetical protein